MARTARGPVPAGTYHVFTRTAGKIAMFHDDVDRTDFCYRLARSCGAKRWSCIAFALLTNHYHLIVQVEADALQAAMRWLNGSYAQAFNGRHERWGHLCGSRYSLVPVRSARQLRHCFRYVALNPVRAGLTSLPEEWLWSSYAGTASLSDRRFGFVDDTPLHVCFGHDELGAVRMRTYVENALTNPLRGTVPG